LRWVFQVAPSLLSKPLAEHGAEEALLHGGLGIVGDVVQQDAPHAVGVVDPKQPAEQRPWIEDRLLITAIGSISY